MTMNSAINYIRTKRNIAFRPGINFEYALSNEDLVKRERDQIMIDSIERLGI